VLFSVDVILANDYESKNSNATIINVGNCNHWNSWQVASSLPMAESAIRSAEQSRPPGTGSELKAPLATLPAC
jgi:hypothetical protein